MADDPDISPLAGQIAIQYPALAKIMDNISLGYGPKDAGGFMEAYPPWEGRNPTPGRYNISVFNRDVKGQDLRDMIAADALHFLGGVDPKGNPVDPTWRALKQQFGGSLTPAQMAMNQRAFAKDQAEGRAGPRSFEDWMDQSRLDAFLRGGLFPQINPEWRKPGIFTEDQQKLLKQMDDYLQAQRVEQPMDSLEDLKQALAEFGFKASGRGEPAGTAGPADEQYGNLTPNRQTKEEIIEGGGNDPKMIVPQPLGPPDRYNRTSPYQQGTLGLKKARDLHEIRPEIPPLPSLFPRAWTSPLPYDLTYPGMNPQMRQPAAKPPVPANEAALRGSPLLQQAAFQVPGLQTPQASASPLLQLIGSLHGFGNGDQMEQPPLMGLPGALLRAFQEGTLTPRSSYWYSPGSKVLPVVPRQVPTAGVNEDE